MVVTIAIVVIALVCAVVAFATGRRFGVLSLALLAGAMLAQFWAGDLTPRVAEAGFVLVKPPLSSVLALFLTLFPAILLMLSGPKHSSRPHRLYGALVFGVLAVTLLVDPISDAFVIDEFGKTMLGYITEYRMIIITLCIVLAILDVMGTHARGGRDTKHHK